MQEEWRPVVGYEGWYEVSSLGRVKRVRAGKGSAVGKVLVPSEQGRGYFNVSLCRDRKARTFLLHRVVAEAFNGPCPDGLTVNHVDGVKGNNAAVNLEYCTRAENVAHAIQIGLFAPAFEAGRRSSPLNPKQVSEIRSLHGNVPRAELAERYGVAQSTIRGIIARRRWREVD